MSLQDCTTKKKDSGKGNSEEKKYTLQNSNTKKVERMLGKKEKGHREKKKLTGTDSKK